MNMDRFNFSSTRVENKRFIYQTAYFGCFGFSVDHVFGMETMQDDLYNDVAAETVKNVMDGWNGTIFA